MNVIESVIECSVIVLCAQGMDLSRHMVLAVGLAGDFGRSRPVRGGADEGDDGR